ncbi:MAG: Mrp/NBP35 family ATP-binding protein [Actinomycetes bacterium]|jgi:ATP-binding protein involved in chromosome partitioning
MVTVEQVMEALERVRDPELGGNVVELGMVTDVRVDGGEVTVDLALTIAECPLRNHLEGETKRRIADMPGVEDVKVQITAMTRKQRAELMSTVRLKARENAAPTQISPTTRVITVASGKGGVGKSSLSANLAVALALAGHRVGILDADIWGFSIPRMLGVEGRLMADAETRLIEPLTAHGIRVVSTGSITESEETALMLRGPMLSRALEQFLTEVQWGDLDYLVVDMPPGTGDIQMSLARNLPQAEMLVVTTPQKAAQKVAIRVADMARRSHMPIIGVVENMSGEMFGSGGGEELAGSLGVPLLGTVPLDHAVVEGSDGGRPVVLDGSGPAAGAILAIRDRLVELVPPLQIQTCSARIAQLLAELDTASA